MTLVSILLMIALIGLIGFVAYVASEGVCRYRAWRVRRDAKGTENR